MSYTSAPWQNVNSLASLNFCLTKGIALCGVDYDRVYETFTDILKHCILQTSVAMKVKKVSKRTIEMEFKKLISVICSGIPFASSN